MANTGKKFPTANTDAGGVTDANWTAPNNAHADDGTNATGSATTLAALGAQDWHDFDLLAEEGGPIMAGATILSVTTTWEYGITGGGAPTWFYGENIDSVITESSRAGNATYPFVVTRTPTLTRAQLDNASFKIRARATQATVAQTSAISLDYVSVQVVWTFYVDKSGGGVASAKAAGAKTPLVGRAGGGVAPASGSSAKSAIVSGKVAGASTPASAGSVRTAFVSRLSRGGSSTASAAGVRTSLVARSGGGVAPASAGSAKTALVSGKVAGGVAVAKAGVTKTFLLARAGGAVAVAVGRSLARTALVARAGGGVAILRAGGSRTALVARSAGAVAGASGGVDARTYRPSISGYTRTGAGAPLADARVDIFRTDTKEFLDSVTSDGVGRYVYGTSRLIPAFFVRSWKAGDPNIFGTTDEDLVPVEDQVQGPPEP